MSVRGSSNAMYGLKLPTRSMSAVASSGSSTSHCFLVGTISSKEDNEIHLIEYADESNDITCERIFAHKNEVWNLSAAPTDRSLFLTSYFDESHGDYRSTLWKMPAAEEKKDQTSEPKKNLNVAPQTQTLTALANVSTKNSVVRANVWSPHEGQPRAVIVDESTLSVFDFLSTPSPFGAEDTVLTPVSSKALPNAYGAVWDPHNTWHIVSIDGCNIRGWDLRSMSESHKLLNVHEDIIRDVDFNPNKPFSIVTGGEDRRVCVWDLRKTAAPLKTLSNHTHWVWCVKFNRFHDQLILSAGTELVNLWSILSVSSAPLGEMETYAASGLNSQEEKGQSGATANASATTTSSSSASPDRLIKAYSDHEDSIYCVTWSAYDAWIFASLSYDGRFVINHVPTAEKYKILL